MLIASMVLKGMLAFIFITAGTGKVLGLKMHRENFDHWRLPQWFRIVTGIVELLCSVLLLIGFWQTDFAAAGALLLGITCIGGVLIHLRVKDGFKETMPICSFGLWHLCYFSLYISEKERRNLAVPSFLFISLFALTYIKTLLS